MTRKGHSVTVITASDQGNSYTGDDEGVRLIRVRSAPNVFWQDGPLPFITLGKLREIIDEVRPEIIHSHDAALLGIQLLRVAEDLDVPLLASCHYLPRFVAERLEWDGRLEEFTERIIWDYSIKLMNRFDHAIFATRSHRAFFLERDLTVPTTIISNGVDVDRYQPMDGADRDVAGRYNLPDGPRILFVGRLATDKEIGVLIRAMPRVAAAAGAHLLIAGQGEEREPLEALTAVLGMQPWVHFLGYVPDDDLPALYRASTLFAIASICEVQSLPVLEAAATALPIVAADAAALPELVYPGENGYLVPPADPEAMAGAIQQVLADPAQRSRFGEASLRIAHGHANAKTYNAHEELYRQLMAEHAAPHAFSLPAL
jgi:glycosyltransferase involved in cell wall biosynthesis